MSLKLYWCEEDVPTGMAIVKNNPLYFMRNVTLTDTEEVRRILRDLEHAEYVSDKSFTSTRWDQYGVLDINRLSSGCKSVLNVLLASERDNVCISPILMGTSAWTIALTLKCGNLIANLDSILLPLDYDIDVIFDGVKYTKVVDLMHGLSRRMHGI